MPMLLLLLSSLIAVLAVPAQEAPGSDEVVANFAEAPTGDHDPVCPPDPGASELDSDESDDDDTRLIATACMVQASYIRRLPQTHAYHEDYIGSLFHRPPNA
jgi:hypothetical protein